MKKSLLVFMVVALVFSPVQARHTESRVFRISYPDMMYMYWNDHDEPQHFRLYVEKLLNNKPADQVTLKCNDKFIKAAIGDWTSCDVNPHKPVSFIVTKENFKYGAQGFSER